MRRYALSICFLFMIFESIVILLTSSGCVYGCTASGCLLDTVFHFKVNQEMLLEGVYTLEMTLDSYTFRCEILIDQNGGVSKHSCKHDNIVINTKRLNVDKQGYVLVDRVTSLSIVLWDRSPKQVKFTLARNRKPWYSFTGFLTYKTVYPNGPQCRPSCQTAGSKEILLPAQ